jgi:hypothetical protein
MSLSLSPPHPLAPSRSATVPTTGLTGLARECARLGECDLSLR